MLDITDHAMDPNHSLFLQSAQLRFGSRAESRKLRSSCDGCGTAKVKCDRGQPICSRCRELDIPCVYGTSRQMGKRPRRKLGTKPTTIQPSSGVDQPSNTASTQAPLFPQTFSLMSNPDPMLSLDGPASLDHVSLSLPGSFDGWPRVNHMVHHTTSPFVTDMSIPSGDSIPEDAQPRRHACSLEANDILRKLTLPDPFAEITSITVLSTIDGVLQANRCAIDSLGRLLECPCSRLPHHIMLHASIISKILMWYQDAAGCATSVSWKPATPLDDPSDSTFESSATSPRMTTSMDVSSCANSNGSIIMELPFTVGTFSIEEPCVQLAFRNQLIGHELKRVGSLIEQFTSTPSSKDQHRKVDALHQSLAAWLREEHSTTMRVLRDAIKTLADSIDI